MTDPGGRRPDQRHLRGSVAPTLPGAHPARTVVQLGRLGSALFTILLIVWSTSCCSGPCPARPSGSSCAARRTSRQELLEAARERWGLDKPVFPDQFVAYLASTLRGDLGFSFVARGQPVERRPGAADLADDHPVRSRRARGDRPRPRARGVLGLATRRADRLPGQRRCRSILYSTPYFLLGMVLLLIFATTLGWFPTFGMLTVGGDRTTASSTASLDFGGAPRAAARDGRPRARRPVRDRHALVDRRDAVRGLHHDGPRRWASGRAGSCAATRSRTRSCRRCPSSRSTWATSSPGRSRSRSSSTGPASGR